MTEFNAKDFDFADLSDLPTELAGKLTRDIDAKITDWVEIVNAAAAFGYKQLVMAQIMAVANRRGVVIPGEATVRKYLNRAVDLKLVSKPTRLTYAAYDASIVNAIEADDENAPVTADDPLAGLV